MGLTDQDVVDPLVVIRADVFVCMYVCDIPPLQVCAEKHILLLVEVRANSLFMDGKQQQQQQSFAIIVTNIASVCFQYSCFHHHHRTLQPSVQLVRALASINPNKPYYFVGICSTKSSASSARKYVCFSSASLVQSVRACATAK